MSKNIENYLPDKTEVVRPVQGNVNTNLFAAVDGYRKAKKLTWSELIVALFQRLVDEKKLKVKS